MRLALQERCLGILGAGAAQVTPHLPANPEQQDSTGEQEPNDCQQFHSHRRECQTHHRCGNNADEYCLAPLRLRQAGGRQADHHGIVAGEHQVDHDHLGKRGERTMGGKIEVDHSRCSACRKSLVGRMIEPAIELATGVKTRKRRPSHRARLRLERIQPWNSGRCIGPVERRVSPTSQPYGCQRGPA